MVLMKQSLQQPCSMKELLLWPWRAFWKLSNPITQLAGITKSWCWNRSLPEPGGWKSTVVLGTNICRSPQTPLTCMRMVWRSACVFLSVYHFGHFTDTHTHTSMYHFVCVGPNGTITWPSWDSQRWPFLRWWYQWGGGPIKTMQNCYSIPT